MHSFLTLENRFNTPVTSCGKGGGFVAFGNGRHGGGLVVFHRSDKLVADQEKKCSGQEAYGQVEGEESFHCWGGECEESSRLTLSGEILIRVVGSLFIPEIPLAESSIHRSRLTIVA